MIMTNIKMYDKFNNETITITIPKNLLPLLLKDIKKYHEVLDYERMITRVPAAVNDDMRNVEILSTKIILHQVLSSREEILLDISIAEFLVLMAMLNCSISYIQSQCIDVESYEGYFEFLRGLGKIYGMLDTNEVDEYYRFLWNYKVIEGKTCN